MTSVWLFKPRSHERKKEATRARNGAPLPGRTPSFLLAPSIGVFGFVPVWARSIFSSSVREQVFARTRSTAATAAARGVAAVSPSRLVIVVVVVSGVVRAFATRRSRKRSD